jgi:hypothetical protein
MTKYHTPTLEAVRHGYPFLLHYVFDWRDTDKLLLGSVQSLINEYLARHIRRIAAKKGSSSEAALELLTREIRAGHISTGVYGDIAASILKSLSERYITIKSDFDGMAALRLKRFGECLGIEPVDGSGHRHELGTELFEGMVPSRADGGFDYLGQFIHAWIITMPRWQAYGVTKIDVAAELASAARYVPDVEWHTDAAAIAGKLFEYYLQNNRMCSIDVNGVEVGSYHGIPIRMQVLFGDKERDQIWRKGSVTFSGTELLFDNQSSGDLYIRYAIRTVDGSSFFEDAATGIDYEQEQKCLYRLSKILLDAFSARNLAETIVKNPHLVAWKLKEPQVQAATA